MKPGADGLAVAWEDSAVETFLAVGWYPYWDEMMY